MALLLERRTQIALIADDLFKPNPREARRESPSGNIEFDRSRDVVLSQFSEAIEIQLARQHMTDPLQLLLLYSTGRRSRAVTEVTYYRWRSEFGRLKADQVKRLKHLRRRMQGLAAPWLI